MIFYIAIKFRVTSMSVRLAQIWSASLEQLQLLVPQCPKTLTEARIAAAQAYTKQDLLYWEERKLVNNPFFVRAMTRTESFQDGYVLMRQYTYISRLRQFVTTVENACRIVEKVTRAALIKASYNLVEPYDIAHTSCVLCRLIDPDNHLQKGLDDLNRGNCSVEIELGAGNTTLIDGVVLALQPFTKAFDTATDKKAILDNIQDYIHRPAYDLIKQMWLGIIVNDAALQHVMDNATEFLIELNVDRISDGLSKVEIDKIHPAVRGWYIWKLSQFAPPNSILAGRVSVFADMYNCGYIFAADKILPEHIPLLQDIGGKSKECILLLIQEYWWELEEENVMKRLRANLDILPTPSDVNLKAIFNPGMATFSLGLPTHMPR